MFCPEVHGTFSYTHLKHFILCEGVYESKCNTHALCVRLASVSFSHYDEFARAALVDSLQEKETGERRNQGTEICYPVLTTNWQIPSPRIFWTRQGRVSGDRNSSNLRSYLALCSVFYSKFSSKKGDLHYHAIWTHRCALFASLKRAADQQLCHLLIILNKLTVAGPVSQFYPTALVHIARTASITLLICSNC